ncbi:helix-turn-helix transcriptional regulator [Marinobacter sp.]|uniref:helix-turn-helix transcriptional regulator n=1 Tax=Marinobacter sp. TaxID=50741 RepID=UPI00356676A9
MLSARLQTLPEFTHEHRHEHHQAVIGVYGGAEVSVNGREGRLDTWRACLVPADIRHEFSGGRENQVLVINVDAWHPQLHEPHYQDFLAIDRLFRRPATIGLDPHLQQLVQLSAGEIRRSSTDHGIRNHLATAILLALAGRLEQGMENAPRHRPGLDPETLRRYVLENLSQRITVEDLAAQACLSPSRFHELFREAMATSPYRFLLNTRLDQACEMLRTTHLSVADISSRAGFSSQSAFTTALRKHRGLTPTQLRSRQ